MRRWRHHVTRAAVMAYVGLLVASTAYSLLAGDPTQHRFNDVASSMAYFAVAIAATVLIVRERGAREPSVLTVRTVWTLIAIGVALRFAGAFVVGPVDVPVDTPGRAMDEFPWVLFVIGVVGSWVIAPLSEEWVFRGYLLPRSPRVRDVIINATLFAALHPWDLTDPVATLRSHVAVFGIGLALAMTKKVTGSTWACVLLHMVVNVAVVLTVTAS